MAQYRILLVNTQAIKGISLFTVNFDGKPSLKWQPRNQPSNDDSGQFQDLTNINSIRDVIYHCNRLELLQSLKTLKSSHSFENSTEEKLVFELTSILEREKIPTPLTNDTLKENGFSESLSKRISSLHSKLKEKKTIIVIPELISVKDNKTLLNNLKCWAKELIECLEFRKTPNYAFCFYKPDESTLTGDTARLSDIISRVQFIKCTKFLDKHLSQMSRPGPVLLEGETGSGKTTLAHMFYERYRESNKNKLKSFLNINVSAISSKLIESRLRGYSKGAFTDAFKDHEGWFEQANNGLLFLDEFQEAPPEVQTQLLDLLNATDNWAQVYRINEEHKKKTVNVKVIIALNEPVEKLIREKRLRKDLFYRIRTQIKFPSLNQIMQNPEIIKPESQESFIEKLSRIYIWKNSQRIELQDLINDVPNWQNLFYSFDIKALQYLVARPWEGNYRELEKVIADSIYNIQRSAKTVITHEDLSFNYTEELSHQPSSTDYYGKEQIIREVELALKQENFAITHAYKKLKHLKLGSVNSLRSWIIKNFEKLSDETRKNSKISRYKPRLD